jgi:hypothetical protein
VAAPAGELSLAGEDAVKAAGQKYLPRLDSQSDEEYEAYKARVSFFGVTARTLEEYLDRVFRRAPVTNPPDGEQVKGHKIENLLSHGQFLSMCPCYNSPQMNERNQISNSTKSWNQGFESNLNWLGVKLSKT